MYRPNQKVIHLVVFSSQADQTWIGKMGCSSGIPTNVSSNHSNTLNTLCIQTGRSVIEDAIDSVLMTADADDDDVAATPASPPPPPPLPRWNETKDAAVDGLIDTAVDGLMDAAAADAEVCLDESLAIEGGRCFLKA